MKTVTFKKDHEFFAAGTTTTLDDTWADQLLKAKIVTLAKAEAPIVSSSISEHDNAKLTSVADENQQADNTNEDHK